MRRVYNQLIADVGERMIREMEENPKLIDMGISGNPPMWLVEKHARGKGTLRTTLINFCSDVLSGVGAIIERADGRIQLRGTGRFAVADPDALVDEMYGPILLPGRQRWHGDVYSFTIRNFIAGIVSKESYVYFVIEGKTDAESIALDYRMRQRWQDIRTV